MGICGLFSFVYEGYRDFGDLTSKAGSRESYSRDVNLSLYPTK